MGEAVFSLAPAARAGAREEPALVLEDDARRTALIAHWLTEAAHAQEHATSCPSLGYARVVRRDLLDEADRLMVDDAEAAARWLVACADVLVGLPERAAVAGLLEQLIARGVVDDFDTLLRAKVWMWSSHLLSLSPDAVGMSDVVQDRRARAAALLDDRRSPYVVLQLHLISLLNFVATGDFVTAIEAARAGAELARAIASPTWTARFDVWLASAAHSAGDTADAVRLALAALERGQRVHDPYTIVVATVVLRTLPPGTVDPTAPIPPLTAALELARARGEALLERFALAALTSESLNAGDPATAARWCGQLLAPGGYAGWLVEAEIALVQTVLIAAAAGDHEFAARMLGAVRADLERVLRAMAPATTPRLERERSELSARFGPAGAAALVGAGAVLSITDAASEAVIWHAAHAAPAHPSGNTDVALTARECEVLSLLAQGLTNKEIAVRLAVSAKTVMHHSGAIYRKLGVRGRGEASAYAYRHGLV
ncbi:hypothetical protein GCM10022200_17980 [Microbacterium awajiense]|uniref:HTH luxR-type domain-containing protein n=1 Tax=Microbacterium awajiense TaxID=415214 RepID=A0ABP7AKV8_9MICO